MKTWDDWSDYEVNKAAVKFLEINFEDMSDFFPEPYLFNEDSRREFNLCNSWADMGPIIQSKQIDLISPTAGGMNVWQAEKFYPEIFSGNINASAKIHYAPQLSYF